MNALAFYANTFLWLYLVIVAERRGNVFAHKVRVVMSTSFDCPCRICHPES